MSALYQTTARAVGGRTGHVETLDGALKLDLGRPKELGGDGKGNNPEQLFASGYAACFGSALQLVAGKMKLPLQDSAITATVGLRPNGQGGFQLTAALDVETKGLDQATAESLAAAAHKVCPYSNAIRGNVDVAISVRAT
jgi:osmotically inducible protein OsmC